AWANAAAVPRRMRSARPLPEVLQTDLNGKCSIELPSEGTYRVAVRSEGYLDADDVSQFEHSEAVQVDAGKTVKLFVDLVRSASFQGTVYLEDGRRVPGASVRLQAAALSWSGTVHGAAPKWLLARTDAQGNYSFPVVPPAQYGMWIAPPSGIVDASLEKNDRGEWTGYGTVVWHTSVEEMRRIVPVDIAPGEDVRGYNVVLRKTRVFPFKGTLREWSGEPVLQAKVAIRAETEVPITLLEPRSVNGLTGEFDFPALPEGHYSLLVYRDDAPDAPPYAVALEAGDAAPRERTADADPDSRRVIQIPPWALIAGRVTVIRPDPVAAVQPAPGETPKPPAVRRDSYSQPAPVVVSLTPDGPGLDARVESLKLESSDARYWNGMEFPAAALPPGDYQFNVQAPEPWYVASAKWLQDQDLLGRWVFTVPARRYDRPAWFYVELRQGGAALEGLVVNDHGEPVSGGSMCALAKDPARARQPGGAFCVRADGDGAFRSRWMSPGDWIVWAFPKKPRENPASPAFKDKYEKRGLALNVPENGAVGRRSILAIE
ncbi:MAG: carboxypeptidase-like regulatory domain-containing protein, partial [Bryobacteraceae bacterium]|nr:carboxypeptidase-like regulatory domain-containing protein [Bryobacteraceae bacterium]